MKLGIEPIWALKKRESSNVLGAFHLIKKRSVFGNVNIGSYIENYGKVQRDSQLIVTVKEAGHRSNNTDDQ